MYRSVKKVCKIQAFNFQLDEEDWIKFVTHVVAVMWRRFTYLGLCSLYCDAKERVQSSEGGTAWVCLHGLCCFTWSN